MAARSRKKGRRTRSSPGTPRKRATPIPARPAPPLQAAASPDPAAPEPSTEPLSRSQRRDAAAREALAPLAPGERPWPLVVSAVVACSLALVSLVFYAIGTKLEIGGHRASFTAVIPYTAVMLACGIGSWMKKYWAVLGFETLLAIGLLGASLALIKVETWYWGIGCCAIIGGLGYLFWKLVRVMGRIQMPTPPSRRER